MNFKLNIIKLNFYVPKIFPRDDFVSSFTQESNHSFDLQMDHWKSILINNFVSNVKDVSFIY